MAVTLNRRRFLQRVAAGSAVLATPAFMSGCKLLPVIEPAAPLPQNPFLDWFDVDEARLSATLRALTARGADRAEIFFQHRRSNVLTMTNGIARLPQADMLSGAAMRVAAAGQSGFAHTADLSRQGMLAAANAAAAGGEGVALDAPDIYTTEPPGALYRIERAWPDVPGDAKLALLRRADELARAADPAVDNVSLHWRDVDERVLIATHDGRLVADERPLAVLGVQVHASRAGQSVSGFANLAARAGIDWYTEERLAEVVTSAVARTLQQFDARQPPAGEMPVVLAAGSGGVVLHEAIGHGLEADFVRDGTSAYADRVGEQVAAEGVTWIDDAATPRARGALNVDDEGRAGQRSVLIERGRLRGYLHNAATAADAQVAPTGNARCQSYRHEPLPRMTCSYLDNGPYTPDEVLAAVPRGILAETFVDGRVDLGGGDFEFQVKTGWLLENGKKTMPIRDLRLRGNGPDMLRKVQMVANDGELAGGGWTCGKLGQRVPVSLGMPTTLVAGLAVDSAASD